MKLAIYSLLRVLFPLFFVGVEKISPLSKIWLECTRKEILMSFTANEIQEIEELAEISRFPDSVSQLALKLLIRFVEENQRIHQITKEDQTRAIQSMGKILRTSLSRKPVRFLLEEHQMYFGKDSANLVRLLLGRFITLVAEMINQDGQET
jgi:hypothetical protein